MKFRKVLAFGLMLGMVAGSLSVADAAKRKRKIVKFVPIEKAFFLRADACEGDEADNLRLSLEDGTDGGNLCGWADYGIFNEFYMQSGQVDPVTDLWPTTDGVPLLLDATKPIAGLINFRSSHLNDAPDNGLSLGQPTVDIVLTGVTGGETVELGAVTEEYTVTPEASLYPVEFEIDPDDALNKKKFDSVQLEVTIHGPAFQHGLYELDDPASTVTVAALKKKVIRK